MANKQLPDYKKRMIFKMTLEDKGVGEIAKRVGCSTDTVKKYQSILESIVKFEVNRIMSSPDEIEGGPATK